MIGRRGQDEFSRTHSGMREGGLTVLSVNMCCRALTSVVLSQVDEDVALDQAVKFCQIQLATSAQRQVRLSSSVLTCHLSATSTLSLAAAHTVL